MKYRNWAGKGRQVGKVAAPGRSDVRLDRGQFAASTSGCRSAAALGKPRSHYRTAGGPGRADFGCAEHALLCR